MIKFENITKKYSSEIVGVEKTNFNIDPGEFVFITGPSGAGKSTIIRLLLKEIDPDSGKIILDGEDITKVSKRMIPMIRTKIGVVFQDFRLLSNRNVYQNIEFVLDVMGLSKKEKRAKIDEVLDLVKLKDRKKAYPHELSGGERQRVSIARALSIDPIVLIADEPTGNLDPISAWDIIRYFEKINNLGTTVIINTHSKEIVDAMGKRVITLEKGHIIRDSIGGYDYEIS